MLAYYVTQKSNMASKMAANTSPNDRKSITIDSNLMILMSIPMSYYYVRTISFVNKMSRHKIALCYRSCRGSPLEICFEG